MKAAATNTKAILTDTTMCIGCRECVLACRKVNGLDKEIPRRWNIDDGLSARNWTSIIDKPGDRFIRKQCRHCLQPACVAACPVGALYKTDQGAVVYDSHKCLGCRYCMMACPYGIPRYDWDRSVPYVRKCNLCYDTRLKNNRQPACTEVCPTRATIFGDRDDLIGEAHRRIMSNPGRYIDKVWGEYEVGGTSVFYISDIDLSFLTHNRPLGERPLPTRISVAMNAVPFAFLGAGGLMAGLYWIINRREQNGKQPDESEPPPCEE